MEVVGDMVADAYNLLITASVDNLLDTHDVCLVKPRKRWNFRKSRFASITQKERVTT